MASVSNGQAAWLKSLLDLETMSEREAAFLSAAHFHDQNLFPLIHAELIRSLYADQAKAARLGEVAALAARVLTDDVSRAIFERCRGNLLFSESRYLEAVEAYQESIKLFERAGRKAEAGRVFFGGMQALSYLGRYEQAHLWAQEARLRFEAARDFVRLARLDLNTGNLYFRQDRYREALECYSQARAALATSSEPQDFAAVLSNSAVCLSSMGHFSEALAHYREAQEWCHDHQLGPLSAAADYNVAYLHFLRGEYRRATQLYQSSRKLSSEVGDAYHRALCDLDEAEMMLELNMASNAQQLAISAAAEFSRLGMPYEQAKSLAYVGLAKFQRHDSAAALKLLRRSYNIFRKERNRFWVGLIDLYRAIIYEREEEWTKAQRLAERAYTALSPYQATGKPALCNLLRAKLAARNNRFFRSRMLLEDAETTALSPALRCHIAFLQGILCEESDDDAGAEAHYREASAIVENTRDEFWNQELKIAYFKDKTAIYEALTMLALKAGGPDSQWRAFKLVQRAKSRTLLESLYALEDTSDQNPAARSASEAMHNLTASYHQLETVASQPKEENKAADLQAIRDRIQSNEQRLSRLWLEETHAHHFGLRHEQAESSQEYCRDIPPDSTLVEFFVIRDRIHVWVLTSHSLSHQVCGFAPVASRSLQLLQFQLGRLTLGDSNTVRTEQAVCKAIQVHLRELYDLLILPIRHLLSGRRLVVAPNSFLHHVPFAALANEDGRNLLDDFIVSVIPSLTIYRRCLHRNTPRGSGSLVLAAPDESTPLMRDEALGVAQFLPAPQMLMDSSATVEALLRKAPSSQYIHIAAHGLQRTDNPLFSAIHLGNSQFRLADFDSLKLCADLVTLSGCSTGVSVVKGADELLGLTRGFLEAGAKALLATLWDVSDKATAGFMIDFYRKLFQDQKRSSAVALRDVMMEYRNRGDGVYAWGAFQLFGIG